MSRTRKEKKRKWLTPEAHEGIVEPYSVYESTRLHTPSASCIKRSGIRRAARTLGLLAGAGEWPADDEALAAREQSRSSSPSMDGQRNESGMGFE